MGPAAGLRQATLAQRLPDAPCPVHLGQATAATGALRGGPTLTLEYRAAPAPQCQCSKGGWGGRRARPVAPSAEGVPLVVPGPLGEVGALSALRIHLPQDLRPPDARALAVKARLSSSATPAVGVEQHVVPAH